MDELRIFKITEEREGNRTILMERNNCRRSQRDNELIETSSASKKKKRQWHEREKIYRNEIQNITSGWAEFKMPLWEFFREPSFFFTPAYTRRKVSRRLGSCLKAKIALTFFISKHVIILFDTVRLSPNIFTRTHVHVCMYTYTHRAYHTFESRI